MPSPLYFLPAFLFPFPQFPLIHHIQTQTWHRKPRDEVGHRREQARFKEQKGEEPKHKVTVIKQIKEKKKRYEKGDVRDEEPPLYLHTKRVKKLPNSIT
jgi:hypothetical protein